jgi:hypothetical protein
MRQECPLNRSQFNRIAIYGNLAGGKVYIQAAAAYLTLRVGRAKNTITSTLLATDY